MNVLLHLITYASLALFVLAVAVRFVRIQNYPLHLRWEVYPVPHEGKRAEHHGGSRMEEVDWWEKPIKKDKIVELKFMLEEMILIKALFINNFKLWLRSFPFHIGLYILGGFIALLGIGAIVELAGGTIGAGGGTLGKLIGMLTVLSGAVGLILALAGAVGLLIMRLTDEDLKPFTNFSHIFNLVFVGIALGLSLIAWLAVDHDFALLRGYVSSIITFKASEPTGSSLVSASVVVGSIFLAYMPLTHMSHFFVKWFTWHKIRWDDEPNVKGGRIDLMIQDALQYPVSWSADHIGGDGKKTWADVATEEIDQS